ncbi:hypothetical protein Tco_0952043 [Tanacetum coccineum]|uniref:Uncharacterized protein n=1 Tax=Tanacetum coccineum TaxID=301880 RepID=A0ABQ5DWJ4_9ASTR
MGRGTMTIDDEVIRHTYFPKPRAKSYLENFEVDEDEDWVGCFEVGQYKDGNPKYGPVAPSFLDIEDEMERLLAMEAYFNPFKNIIVFKKLIDFLGIKDTPQNPLITKYEKKNGKKTINYTLKPITSAYLRWRDLPSVERHAYSERLLRLQQKNFGTPRVVDWDMFNNYSCDETLRDLMKMEYTHEDGDEFVDYSCERAFSIKEDVYMERCLLFFSTMYFERKVDRTKIMKETCIWFRLCGEEHVFTLPEFAVILGLYDVRNTEKC